MQTVKNLSSLKNRVVLITGGAGYLGSAMAEALAEQGAGIVIVDNNEAQIQKVVESLERDYGVETLALSVDLGNEEAVRSIPEQIAKRFKGLDVLINCAALVGTSSLPGWAVPFLEQSSDTWRKALEINLTAVFELTQACSPSLIASGHGSIINITSIYSMVGPYMGLYEGSALGNPAAYSVSKGGLLQYTRWLATVLAPTVRVNAITMGGVFRAHTEPFLSRYIERTPLKRMATEEDIKGAVVYLASDLSQYVTGQNIVVDGGWTAW